MAPRLARWSRAQVLTWIMTRRLNAVAETTLESPRLSRGMPGASLTRWSIDDTLRRMQAGPAGRSLPRFPDAFAALAEAEQDGLTPAADDSFRSDEVRRRWPSPFGRRPKRSDQGAGGVAPRAWDERIVRKLTGKFVRESRNMTREDLREWVGGVPFTDPERWTAYVRRAIAAATIDILLRRQCCCPNEAASAQCEAAFGRRFCWSRDEGAAMLANVWSWRADGPLPPRN